MKHLKAVGAAVIAAAALGAFTGSASATVLTSPVGFEYTGTMTWTASESLLFKGEFSNVTCTESTISGTVKTNAMTAEISISSISFTNCSVRLVVIRTGSLTVASGGAVTGRNVEWTTEVSGSGTSCVYGFANGTALGTLKGGTPASLQISASLPKLSGGFACPSSVAWSGKYAITKPTTVLVD